MDFHLASRDEMLHKMKNTITATLKQISSPKSFDAIILFENFLARILSKAKVMKSIIFEHFSLFATIFNDNFFTASVLTRSLTHFLSVLKFIFIVRLSEAKLTSPVNQIETTQFRRRNQPAITLNFIASKCHNRILYLNCVAFKCSFFSRGFLLFFFWLCFGKFVRKQC